MRRTLVALSLCAASAWTACVHDSLSPIVVSVSGLPAGALALRVNVTLDGVAATEVKEVRRELLRFGLRLPPLSQGELQLQIDATDANRCVLGRGFAKASVEAAQPLEIAISVTTLATPLCQCAATGWCWEAPLPQGNHLRAVYVLSPHDAWAVGDHGTILQYDGTSWRSIPSGTTAHLRALWAGAADEIWAVGERGTVLRYNGTSFTPVNSRTTVTVDLDAVFGFLGAEVFAAGGEGTVLRMVDGTTIVPEFVGTRRRLRGLWGSAPDDLWAVGDDGFVRRRAIGRWTQPAGAHTDKDLYAVSGYRDKDVWAVGEAGTILHISDGVANSEGTAEQADLTALWVPPAADPPLLEPEDLWAAGALRGFSSGVVLRRRNGVWAEQPVANRDSLNVFTGVFGSGPNDLWAVGLYGTLLAWRDGKEQILGATDTTRVLRAIWGSGPEDLWALGGHEGLPAQAATVLHYDGKGWSSLPQLERSGPDLSALWGSGPQDVWAVGRGGAVLHYDGAAWAKEDVATLTRADLAGVWAGGGEVWAVGKGGVLLRRTGGTWTKPGADPSFDFTSVFGFAEPTQELWVGGGDGKGRGVLLRRRGAMLSAVPGGTFAKVLAIAGGGPADLWATTDKGPMLHFDGERLTPVDTGTTRSLSGLWFAGPEDGWAVGEEGRILFWDGRTWARLISGTNNDLNAVFGTGLRSLWAVGQGGTILRQRL